jgi:O-antigen/teichoic acid export membrane protein
VIPTAPRAMLRALLHDDLLRRMLRNTSYLLTGTAGASFLGLVALALTARALGPELLGILALIQAYVRLVDRVRIEAWPALIKYGAEALEHQRYDDFKSMIKLGVLLDAGSALFATAVAVAGVFVAGWWLEWTAETINMACLFSISILFRWSSMPTAVLRLFNRFGVEAFQEVFSGVVRVLLVAIAYMAGAGLWTFLLITLGMQILSSLILIVAGWAVLWRESYRGILRSSCKGIRQRFPGIWTFIWSLNAGNLVRRSTSELDILFVGAVVDPAAASLYQIAKKLGDILSLATIPIQQVVYPELARLWARAEAALFRRTVLQIDLCTGALGVTYLLVIFFQGDLLIRLTVGAEFAAAAGPLLVHTLAVCVFLFGTALRPALFSMAMQMRFLQIITLSTVCFYATLLVAVPAFGIYGANLSHLVYNIVWLIAMQAALFEGLRQGPARQDGTGLTGDMPSRPA